MYVVNWRDLVQIFLALLEHSCWRLHAPINDEDVLITQEQVSDCSSCSFLRLLGEA